MAKHHVSTAATASGIVFAPIPSKNGKITTKATRVAQHLTAASLDALHGVAFTGVGVMAKQARHVCAGKAFTLTDAINASNDGEMLSGGRYADLRTLIAADWAIGSQSILACTEGKAKEQCARMVEHASRLASAQYLAACDEENPDKRERAMKRASARIDRLDVLDNMLQIQFALADADAQARREREAAELTDTERVNADAETV